MSQNDELLEAMKLIGRRRWDMHAELVPETRHYWVTIWDGICDLSQERGRSLSSAIISAVKAAALEGKS